MTSGKAGVGSSLGLSLSIGGDVLWNSTLKVEPAAAEADKSGQLSQVEGQDSEGLTTPMQWFPVIGCEGNVEEKLMFMLGNDDGGYMEV